MSVLLFCKNLLLTFLFITLLLPLGSLFTLVNLLLRLSVQLLAKCIRRDLHRAVSTTSAFFALDLISGGPPKSNIVISCILNGKGQSPLEVDDLVRIFEEKVIHPSKGEEVTQLREYIVSWLGYSFWKLEDSFNLREHIKSYDGELGSLQDLQMRLTNLPWLDKKSPWEVLLVPALDDKQLLFVRTHHAFSDGFSLVNLLTKCVQIEFQETDCSKYQSKVKFQLTKSIRSALKWISFPFLAPYQMISYLGDTLEKGNDWRLDPRAYSGEFSARISEEIPLGELKSVKRALKVRLSAVILGLIGGAVEKTMEQAGSPIPDKIQIIIPLILPRKEDRIENRMSFARISIPLGTKWSQESRIKMLDNQMTRLAQSFIPVVNFALFKISGIFPNPILRRISSGNPTCLVSNFPGPQSRLSLMDRPIESILFQVGIFGGTIGAGFLIMGYNNNLRFTTIMDKAISSSNKGSPKADQNEMLMENIYKEIISLNQLWDKGDPGINSDERETLIPV